MITFDELYQPYRTARLPVYAKNGMVAASQPQAADCGRQMLEKGGNAVDAAIAAAAALTVVEPTSNGIGGDAFALVWMKEKLYGLNASGRSPREFTLEKLKEKGLTDIPDHGFIPVTVPGAPGAWAELSEAFGVLPLEEVLAPAVKLAEEGFPVSAAVAKYWKRGVKLFNDTLKGPEFEEWFRVFTKNGRAPQAGDLWTFPDHAKTLRDIAATKAASFYEGELAEKIGAFSKQHGGFIAEEDLNAFQADWVTPISVSYKGYDVWEIPPNGHGLNTLLALNILEEVELSEKESPETYHVLMEAMKLGYTDGLHYITDPKDMNVTVEELLSKTYAAERREAIGEEAMLPKPGKPQKGGTVYLAAADKEGNMVSYIQSNYMDFGSGLVVPGTGINLQNRGRNFSMDENAVNVAGPAKRTYHTIIPGFLTKDGRAAGAFGVMGGFMQPQGHLQVLASSIDFGLNPQAALDAPRWRWSEKKTIEIEPLFPDHIAQALERKGHHIRKATDETGFGRGQIIWKDPDSGVYIGGTESRADGHISVY